MHYQQFDCSTSGTDDELSEAMLPIPTYPQNLEQPELTPSLGHLPSGRTLSVSTTLSLRQLTSAIAGWNVCSSNNESFAH